MKRAIVVASLWCVFSQAGEDRILNGYDVSPADFPAVLRLDVDNGKCSAVVVGPKVVLTAAHCATPMAGGRGYLQMGNKSVYVSLFRSELYEKGHDLAVGISEFNLEVPPVSIGGQAQAGDEVEILGFGCTETWGAAAGNALQAGLAKVNGFSELDVVSQGAGLCFGDSGGPAFLSRSHTLVGIASKGNIKDTNYHTRLDLKESRSFLDKIAAEEKVEICGVNVHCKK